MTFRFDRDTRRRWFDVAMSAAALACVGIAILPLGSILFEASVRGAAAITPSFLTLPAGSGGIANSIQGTLVLIGLTGLVALPVGILTGIYLAEFGRNRIGGAVRFFVDVMTQIPSIVVGIFAYSFVLELGVAGIVSRRLVFSTITAVIALSTIMIPFVARTSEEALRLVTTSTREAALALGIPRYKVILRVVLPSCASALVTGGLLGIARVGGETAPLIMTAFASPDFFTGLDQPIDALPLPFGQKVTILAAKIRVEKLSAWYGTKLAIEDINLELEEHTVSGIIGPSGCGKSTLIRCLNRMHETIPKARVEGKVHLDQDDIYELPAVSVRRRIGMVFQKPNPFPTMSIYDNVAAGLRLNGERDRDKLDAAVLASLKQAALWDEVKDSLDKSGASLSGGQQQRLCIARALAVKPEVVLMDEPCSALDPIATAKIEDLIFDLKKDYTVVIVTHNMQQAARVAETTAFMYLGHVIEVGATRELFERPKETLTESYITGRFG